MTTSDTLPGMPTLASPQVVYFATDLCNVKIGRTTRPLRQRGGELKVHMLHALRGVDIGEEQRQHQMWSRYRIGTTEWFRPGDELIIWLAANVPPGDARALAALQLLIFNTKRRAA